VENPALLLIDVQRGFDDPAWGERNNPAAEANIARLLTAWRDAGLPVIHIQHNSVLPGSPLAPGRPGCDFKPEAEPLPGETRFTKTVNSAFIGTGLEDHLRGAGLEELVVAGLTTDHCVSTSVRMAANLGFTVALVGDATATFDRSDLEGTVIPADEIHRVHLASLHDEFCSVLTTEMVLSAIA
jgi:nicotinamidase-related amidase